MDIIKEYINNIQFNREKIVNYLDSYLLNSNDKSVIINFSEQKELLSMYDYLSRLESIHMIAVKSKLIQHMDRHKNNSELFKISLIIENIIEQSIKTNDKEKYLVKAAITGLLNKDPMIYRKEVKYFNDIEEDSYIIN